MADPDAELLRLHQAEYTALMGKSSSFVNLMFGIMAIGFAYLGIIVGHWPDEPIRKVKSLWGCLLPEQLVIVFWSSLLYAQVTIADYIRDQLKPSCIAKFDDPKPAFWGYERYVRQKHVILDYVPKSLPALTSLCALIGVVIFRRTYLHDIHFSNEEYYGIGASALLVLISLWIPIILPLVHPRFVQPNAQAAQEATSKNKKPGSPVQQKSPPQPPAAAGPLNQ